jgi:hypoxanthine phosphoribosyltransferase
MAREIQKRETEKLCVIAILKGGVPTAHRILEQLPDQRNILVGYIGLSSYQNGTETKGEIKTTYGLDLSQEQLWGRNVWIVDDVFDSGLTMMWAKRKLESLEFCNSIKTAVLVRKMNPKIQLYREGDLPDVVGFEYEQRGFLVGMGMGHGEKYRCSDQIYELDPEEIG